MLLPILEHSIAEMSRYCRGNAQVTIDRFLFGYTLKTKMKFKLTFLVSLFVVFSGRAQRPTVPTLDKKLQELFNTSSIYSHALQFFQEDGRYLLIQGEVKRNQNVSIKYYKYDRISNSLAEIYVESEMWALGFRRDSLYLFNESNHTFKNGKKKWTSELSNRLLKVLQLRDKDRSGFDLKIHGDSFIVLNKNNSDLRWHVLASIDDGKKVSDYDFVDTVLSQSSRIFFLDNEKFLSTSYVPRPGGELLAKLYWWDCLSNRKADGLNVSISISDIFDIKNIGGKILVLGHEFGVGYFIGNLIFNGRKLELRNIKRSNIQGSYLDLKLLNDTSFICVEPGPFPQDGILKIYKVD